MQQQEVERALTRSQAELDRQRASAEDRALFAEQMVGIVSHDLRNPLSAIQMSADVLARGRARARRSARRSTGSARSTERAQRLIEDLLDFTVARVGSGLAVTLAPIDLHAVVAGAAEELRTTFPGREIEHCSAGAGRLPRRCRPADAGDRQPRRQRHDLRRLRPAGAADARASTRRPSRSRCTTPAGRSRPTSWPACSSR